VRVSKVFAAVDCGTVVHPDIVKAQIESAIVFGLTAALHGEITVERGRVVQSNFTDYPLLRMSEMPSVVVSLVPSQEPPTGIGEPGTPPIAAAVVNAIYSLTRKRIRQLPLRAVPA
jgi:isoquinoline 1-oxidoreductase subunit beta